MNLAVGAMAVALAAALAGCSGETPQSLIASARSYAAKGDHKAASIQLKSALRLDEKSAEARLLLGQTLLNSGEVVDAAVELDKALENGAPRDTTLPLIVQALLLSGESKRVVNNYGNEKLTDPLAQASVKSSVAQAWMALGDVNKSRAALEEALAAQADFATALVLKARLAARQGDIKAAQAAIELAAAGSGSGRAEAWAVKGDLNNLTQGDPAVSEAAYRKALEIDPRQVQAHTGLIASRLRSGDSAGAEQQAAALRKAWPKHPMTAFVDAQLAFQKREFPRARERIQALLKALPDHVGVLQLAGALEVEAGSIFMAETYFTKALQAAPELVFARRNLARVYGRQGQADRALATLAPLIGPDSTDSEALTIAGEAQLRRESPLEAEAYFERAAKIAPNDERVLTMLAMSHFARGNADAGFSELEDVARKGKTLYAENAIISARLKRNEFDAALAAVDAIERKTTKSAASAELRGRIEMARPDLVAARAAFEQAAKLDPKLYAATASLANIDVAQGKLDDAQKRLEAAVATDPRNHLALLALADISKRKEATVDATKALYQRAVQAAPDVAEARFRQIEFLISKRLFKETLTAAQEASAALPQDMSMLDIVGQAQMAAGDTEQAINSFKRLASVSTRSSLPYLRLADLYKATAQNDQAEAALKRALEIEPENVNAQASLLALLTLGGRKAEALDFARALQRRAPKKAGGYLAESAFHRHQKANDAALAALLKGAQMSADPLVARVAYDFLHELGRAREATAFDDAWQRARAYDAAFDQQLALLDIKHKAFASAELRLLRVVKLQPKNLTGLNNLGWLLTRRAPADAVAYAQRAVELSPNNAAVLDTLAMAHAANRQFDEALKVQRRALELSPDLHDLRLNLASIAKQAGRKDEARQALSRLQALGANYPRQADVDKLLKEL